MLVNENERIINCANETKAVEETRIDERNIIDNRAQRKKNKAKRKENKDGNLEKMELKKNVFSISRGGTE